MDMTNIATCDGVVMCADCPFRDTQDCDKYQDELAAVGRGDDYGPNLWELETPTATAPATKLARIERILGDTQGRRGNNPHYAVNVLDAGPLCYVGK